MSSLTEILISRKALIHNLRQFRKVLGKTQLMAVVKSNAYGHGSFAVSKTAAALVDRFGTASGSEALALREMGIKKPILVLNYYAIEQIRSLIAKNIALVVYDLDQAKAISATAK